MERLAGEGEGKCPTRGSVSLSVPIALNSLEKKPLLLLLLLFCAFFEAAAEAGMIGVLVIMLPPVLVTVAVVLEVPSTST